MSTDIMLDLETTGTRAGCCLLAIGACTIDEKYTFYRTISWNSCKEAGLKDSPGTLAWWDKQSPEARREAFSGIDLLTEVLGEFSDWFSMLEKTLGTPIFVWGNGADFDLPILSAAYDVVNMKQPWAPFNGRCYRTLKNLPYNKDIKPPEFEGLKHNALSDALHQSRHMLKILRETKQKDMFLLK